MSRVGSAVGGLTEEATRRPKEAGGGRGRERRTGLWGGPVGMGAPPSHTSG